MDMIIPHLKIKIMLESNPLKSIMLVGRLAVSQYRKGTDGVSTTGVTSNYMLFDRYSFGVLPLTYIYLPKSVRA